MGPTGISYTDWLRGWHKSVCDVQITRVKYTHWYVIHRMYMYTLNVLILPSIMRQSINWYKRYRASRVRQKIQDGSYCNLVEGLQNW